MFSISSVLMGDKKIIEVVDRVSGKTFAETVFSEDGMRVLYGTQFGVALTSKFFTNQWVSKLYGAYNDSAASKHKIEEFASSLNISLDECEKDIAEYYSFNDFFARKLKAGARPIAEGPRVVASPGDGRLLVFPKIGPQTLSYVKWAPVHILKLFGGREDYANRFSEGSALVLRLCPADYHRFHFPVAGKVSMTQTIDGLLHSVSPYALESQLPVYCLNKRTICEVDSDLAGKVLCMEVGALFVGSIVQTYRAGMHVKKGDEKGYFKFGGSTAICFFEKGAIEFDEDIIQNTEKSLETYVKMGEGIAKVIDQK